ncbi:hypothetical protein ACEYYB_08230 [Paracoccus sp. p4-l81]
MLKHEQTLNDDGRATEDRWPAPLDQQWLNDFLTDMFDNHWQGLCFGPIIEGAAYELRPPGKPERISLNDGYLTVFYGLNGHFHLCIGRNEGALRQGGEALVAQRRPGKAEFFRSLDPEGHPRSWGFRMENGKGEPALSLFFPNPFITPDDRLAETPDWDRLATWDHVRSTYIGLDDGGPDRLSKGYRT